MEKFREPAGPLHSSSDDDCMIERAGGQGRFVEDHRPIISSMLLCLFPEGFLFHELS